MPALSVAWFVAVQAAGPSGWTWLVAAGSEPLDVTQLGVSGTLVAILLYICRQLWIEVKDLRKENVEMAALALEKTTVITTQATLQMEQTSRVLSEASEVIRTLVAKPSLSPEDLYELRVLLKDLRGRQP